jgi:Zn-dependent M16 (insulinase) family peptidase
MRLRLDFLGSKLYSGGGAHSIFMKTWAAGLAYSNGLRSNPSTGRLTYYAERVPKLPQTLGFVIDELKSAKEQPELVEYAIAQSFGEIRSASSYEERAEAIAADLADGLTPDVVRNFRQNILRLRNLKNLSSTIFERMKRVYANVLPGFEKSYREDAIYFVIGPESQLKEYEQYLQSVYGKQTTLYRLYPRDFWLP